MADNYDKLWLQSSLNKMATRRASELIESTGRALPCHVVAVSGSIVTVAFDVISAGQTIPNVTLPKLESQWIRFPVQVGDKGMTVPADTYLGGVSGLGGGIANLSQRRGNLSTLIFVPVGATTFPAVNTNAAYIAGPAGAVIQTQDGSAVLTVSTSGITLAFGGKTVVLNASGFTIDGILFDTHYHTGVTTGSGNTGGPA